jgi:hypothetical protein
MPLGSPSRFMGTHAHSTNPTKKTGALVPKPLAPSARMTSPLRKSVALFIDTVSTGRLRGWPAIRVVKPWRSIAAPCSRRKERQVAIARLALVRLDWRGK